MVLMGIYNNGLQQGPQSSVAIDTGIMRADINYNIHDLNWGMIWSG